MSIYTIAENAKKVRMEKFGESQEKLAERLNVRTRTVQNRERGCCMPKPATLIKIALATGLTLDALLA